jgi:single-strand DNA-binding protein
MNVITITGTLGRDMEQRAMPNGDPVGNFSVADSQGREKPTIWWNCQLFGKRVSALAPYLLKGQQVTVVGTVTEREWVDKDGGKRKQMEIRVNDLALQGGKREQPAEPSPAPRAPRAAPAPAFAGGLDSDDIPF